MTYKTNNFVNNKIKEMSSKICEVIRNFNSTRGNRLTEKDIEAIEAILVHSIQFEYDMHLFENTNLYNIIIDALSFSSDEFDSDQASEELGKSFRQILNSCTNLSTFSEDELKYLLPYINVCWSENFLCAADLNQNYIYSTNNECTVTDNYVVESHFEAERKFELRQQVNNSASEKSTSESVNSQFQEKLLDGMNYIKPSKINEWISFAKLMNEIGKVYVLDVTISALYQLSNGIDVSEIKRFMYEKLVKKIDDKSHVTDRNLDPDYRNNFAYYHYARSIVEESSIFSQKFSEPVKVTVKRTN